MTRPAFTALAFAAVGLAFALYLRAAGNERASRPSEPSPAQESGAMAAMARAPRTQASAAEHGAVARTRKASRPQPDGVKTTGSFAGSVSKGEPLFRGEPLRLPERPLSTESAGRRRDQSAQAQALNPRLERRLERLRAKLRSASPQERQAIQIHIEALERNLEHRRAREAFAPRSSRARGE